LKLLPIYHSTKVPNRQVTFGYLSQVYKIDRSTKQLFVSMINLYLFYQLIERGTYALIKHTSTQKLT